VTIDPARKKILGFEVVAICFLFLLPVTWNGVVSYFYPHTITLDRGLREQMGRLIFNVSYIVPVLFIMWGSGDGFAKFGLTRMEWWKAMNVAILCLVGMMLVRGVCISFLRSVAPDLVKSSFLFKHNLGRIPKSALDGSLALAFYFVGAFAEELILRAYLITRFTELFRSKIYAALLSSALFAVYHCYQGITAVFVVFFHGLLFSLTFLATRNIWPSTFAHTAYNFIVGFLR